MSRSNREHRPGDPVIGPADPATRRRLMNEHIEAGRREAVVPPAKAPPPPVDTRGVRARKIDEAVERAERGY